MAKVTKSSEELRENGDLLQTRLVARERGAWKTVFDFFCEEAIREGKNEPKNSYILRALIFEKRDRIEGRIK